MSNIQILKGDSKVIHDIPNFSAETALKVVNQIPKIYGKTQQNFELVLSEVFKKSPYPNFRFFCPYCASLDVFIIFEKTLNHLTIDCLDCKKRWIDMRLLKN